MTSRLVAVALDCRDPEALAAFWCTALGYRVRERWSDAAATGYEGYAKPSLKKCRPIAARNEDKKVFSGRL